MDESRASDGVEHLQAAARELLLAARSFLDVVEEVVEDRDRFGGAATGVVDLLRSGLVAAGAAATPPPEPWEQAAWADHSWDTTGPETAEPSPWRDPDLTAEAAEPVASEPAEAAASEPAAATAEPAKKAATRKAPAKKASSTTAPPRKALTKKAPTKKAAPSKAVARKPAPRRAPSEAALPTTDAPSRVRRIEVD